MRKNWFFFLFFAFTILILIFTFFVLSITNDSNSIHADENGENSLLPAIFAGAATSTPVATPTATITPTVTTTPTVTPTPTITPTVDPDASPLQNGSFEDRKWKDVPNQDIQDPRGWDLYWVPVGEPLFDAPGDLASGVCECIHKLASQLPPHERPGGEDALILDGEIVYKLFKSNNSWGTELSQTFENMKPGTQWRLTVPVRAHLYDDPDPFGAESGIWVNDLGAWANGDDMGDRQWCKHEQVFTVPEDGQVRIDIRVKSKWQKTKDFFIDDITLELATDPAPHPEMDLCVDDSQLEMYKPAVPRR